MNELRTDWNKVYAEQLNEQLLADPENHDLRFELIWSYLENDERESANPLLAALPEEQSDAFAYYNLKAVVAGIDQSPEEELQYLEKLLEVINHLQPDGTEKTEKRLGRKADIMGRIAVAYMKLDRFEEADEILDRILVEFPDNVDLLMM